MGKDVAGPASLRVGLIDKLFNMAEADAVITAGGGLTISED